MRMLRAGTLTAVALAAAIAGSLSAQAETRLYDHVHMSVPDPQVAAQWWHDHIGGEWVDGRTDRLLFGTTRIMFLTARRDRKPSAGGVIDHLGFSYWDLASKMTELEAAGATVTTPIRDVPGVFQLAYINDPWGVRLEIVQDPQHLGFNHVHLRSPDPEAAFDWYEKQFGGVRLNFKGRIPGILYPGNVWLMIQQDDAFPSSEGVIDHIG